MAALLVVMGLLIAPAAWAWQGPERDRGDASFLVVADQWIQSLLAEMAGRFEIETRAFESSDGSKTDDTSGRPTAMPDGGGDGPGGATDTGPAGDPDG